MTEEGNIYGERTSQQEFDEIMNDAISAEYIRNWIYLLLTKEPMSIKRLSANLELAEKQVLEHVVILRRRGLVAVDRVDDMTPLYTALKR